MSSRTFKVLHVFSCNFFSRSWSSPEPPNCLHTPSDFSNYLILFCQPICFEPPGYWSPLGRQRRQRNPKKALWQPTALRLLCKFYSLQNTTSCLLKRSRIVGNLTDRRLIRPYWGHAGQMVWFWVIMSKKTLDLFCFVFMFILFCFHLFAETTWIYLLYYSWTENKGRTSWLKKFS